MGWPPDVTIRRYRVRFPAPRGHFLVMSGVTFYDLWDMLGWVSDGLGNFFRTGLGGVGEGLTRSKIEIFENVRECFSRVGTPRNSILVTNIKERSRHHFFLAPIFFMVLLISYQPGAGGRGPWPLGSAAALKEPSPACWMTGALPPPVPL